MFFCLDQVDDIEIAKRRRMKMKTMSTCFVSDQSSSSSLRLSWKFEEEVMGECDTEEDRAA